MAWYQALPSAIQTNRVTAQASIKAFKCPSDTVDETCSDGVMVACNGFNGNITMLRYGPAGGAFTNQWGRTNYTGVAGCTVPNSPWDGVLTNRSNLTLGQLTVQDGTSNTLMFGEGIGGNGVARDFAWSWAGIGTLTTWFGLGRGNIPADPALPWYNQRGSTWDNFSSRHTAGVQFAFGDASVRTLRFGNTVLPDTTTILYNVNTTPVPVAVLVSDWGILQQLAGRRDGYNNDPSTLID